MGWFARKIDAFNKAHNRLIHTVHTAWRVPLPPWGQFAMGCVYFAVPIVIGYNTSLWAIDKANATKEQRLGDGKDVQIQGLGDKRIVRTQDQDGGDGTTQVEQLGAGGWGGGVHLVTGDQKTQETNRVNLERFLKKQRRKYRRKQKEAEGVAEENNEAVRKEAQ